MKDRKQGAKAACDLSSASVVWPHKYTILLQGSGTTQADYELQFLFFSWRLRIFKDRIIYGLDNMKVEKLHDE